MSTWDGGTARRDETPLSLPAEIDSLPAVCSPAGRECETILLRADWGNGSRHVEIVVLKRKHGATAGYSSAIVCNAVVAQTNVRARSTIDSRAIVGRYTTLNV